MTSSADIALAWATYVFADSDIMAITKRANPFEFINDSEAALEKLQFGAEVNSFCYKVVTQDEQRLTRMLLHKHYVTIDYYVEQDPAGANWARARNALETLSSVVRASFGNTWQGTVDYWRYADGEPEIVEIKIGSTACWRARTIYEAYSSTSL